VNAIPGLAFGVAVDAKNGVFFYGRRNKVKN
jgi:hypothetical protein